MQELGVADIGEVALWSGVIFTASPLLSAVVAPLWGMLADRYGYKLMIQKALLVFIVTVALMGFVESALQLLALRIMQGLLGGFGPLALTMVSVTSPKTKLGSAMGVMQSAKIMSIVTGPAIGGVLAQFTGCIGYVSCCFYSRGARIQRIFPLFSRRCPNQRQILARKPS